MSIPVSIALATSKDRVEWNDFVSRHPHGSTFHRHEWLDVYRDVYGHDTPYLVARRGEAISGLLPLVRVRSLVFGHYLVSSPYVSYGGPIGDTESETALAQHAASLSQGAKLVELRSRHAVETTLDPITRKLTVLLDLVSGDYDATFKAFNGKLRSQIRRADRDGLRVEFGPTHLRAFHQVFAEHMRDLGSPAHSLHFFERLTAALGEMVWVGVAYLDDVPVAGGFAIENGTEVEISWASSLRRYQKVSPNMALYGAFIRRACEQKFSVFNFGRCTPGSGTHKFKQQWGTRDESLTWYQLRSGSDEAPPSQEGRLFSLATRVWQHLPLGITTPLGARLIGGIP